MADVFFRVFCTALVTGTVSAVLVALRGDTMTSAVDYWLALLLVLSGFAVTVGALGIIWTM